MTILEKIYSAFSNREPIGQNASSIIASNLVDVIRYSKRKNPMWEAHNKIASVFYAMNAKIPHDIRDAIMDEKIDSEHYQAYLLGQISMAHNMIAESMQGIVEDAAYDTLIQPENIEFLKRYTEPLSDDEYAERYGMDVSTVKAKADELFALGALTTSMWGRIRKTTLSILGKQIIHVKDKE